MLVDESWRPARRKILPRAGRHTPADFSRRTCAPELRLPSLERGEACLRAFLGNRQVALDRFGANDVRVGIARLACLELRQFLLGLVEVEVVGDQAVRAGGARCREEMLRGLDVSSEPVISRLVWR